MWYSQGSITATKDNTVITGVGTAFLQGVRVGDGITIAGSTSLHEVISVASNTQLTIKPAYTGATGAGKQYAVAPVLGYDKDLSDAFNQLRLQFGDQLSNLQPWASANTVDEAREQLGLDSLLLVKLDKGDVVGEAGQSTEKVMSQKAVTDKLDYLQLHITGYVPFIGSYGLSHDGVADTYARVGSENFTAIQSMFRRCLLLPDGTVDYYLSPFNSNYKADGTLANITGANGYLGNVMVQIPKYYRKITVDGDVATREVSLLPEEGFTLHPAFIKAGEEVDFRYYRAYQGVEIDGKLRSVSGAVPTRSRNIDQFRNLAKANGTDWHQIDWYVLDAVRELSSIEIGTYHSQAVLGQGNSAGLNYDLASGVSNEIGNGSSTSETSGWMSYRGIENFYASISEFIDGINFRDREPFVNGDHRTFASGVFTGDYVTAGVTQSTVNGYISAMAHTEKGFFVAAVAGSSITFFADYYYQTTGSRVWLHGGGASNAVACGSFYSSASSASSTASISFGAGLAF